MKVHLHIEKKIQELEIHIYTPELDRETEQIMRKLKTSSKSLIGYQGLDIYPLKIENIFSACIEDTKVFLQTDEDEFECKLKLYELEENYKDVLLRVNKSMLVNVNKITSIQSKILNNPQLFLTNGVAVTVGRKYFPILKEKIGLVRGGSK